MKDEIAHLTEEQQNQAREQFLKLGGKLNKTRSKTKQEKISRIKKQPRPGRPKSEFNLLNHKTDEKSPVDEECVEEYLDEAISEGQSALLPCLEETLEHPAIAQIFLKEDSKAGIARKSRDLICDVCGFRTNVSSELTRHLRQHRRDKIITRRVVACEEKKLKKAVNSVKTQTKRSGLEAKFCCDICGVKTRRLFELTKHLKRHVKPTDSCSVCHQIFRNVTKHMRDVHTDRLFSCPICNADFKTQSNLNNHVKIHEEPSECPICHKFLPNMPRHLQWHSKPKPQPHQCPQCKQVCATKQAVQEHIQRIHEKKALGKIYKCEVCELNFIRNRDFRQHSFIHYRGQIFSCTFPGCFEMFKKQFKLKSHMMIHNPTVDKNFHCTQCDRKYLRQTALHKHQKQAHPTATVQALSIRIIKKTV